MSELYNHEDIYDNEISPLMVKIIDICKKNNIPMVASFAYEECEENGRGICTTLINPKSRRFYRFDKAYNIIKTSEDVTCATVMIKK